MLRAPLQKLASAPAMDESQYVNLSSSTGDDGRLHNRTNDPAYNTISTEFQENDRFNTRDPANTSTETPVANEQSTSKFAVDKAKLLKNAPASLAYGEAAHAYNPRTNTIHLPENNADEVDPYILAHEIGHARVQTHALGKAVNSPYARVPGLLAPLAAGGLGYMSHMSGRARAAVVLGMSLPTLLSEGAADYSGYQYLKEHGATDDDLKDYVKTIAPLQASYLALPLMGIAMGHGARALKMASAHKLHGRRQFRNLDISIENRRGSYRHWYDPHAARKGKTLQKYPYGYIRMSEGMDGDHVDCYLGPNEDAKNVYVITTNSPPDFDKIDEQKCMLGFSSATAAKKAFLAHFDNPRFFRSLLALPYEKFEKKVLATRRRVSKKIAAASMRHDPLGVDSSGPGPSHDQTPGDYLGFPGGSLVGMRSIVGGNTDAPSDRIDRMFRFQDMPQDASTLDSSSAAPPAGPET